MEIVVRRVIPDDGARIADIYNQGIQARTATFEHNTRAFPFLGDSPEVSFTANTGGVKPHGDFLRSRVAVVKAARFFFRGGAMFPDHAV